MLTQINEIISTRALPIIIQFIRMKNGGHPCEYVQRANVHTTIDECGHIRARLFHIMVDCTRQIINHQAAIMYRLLLGGFGAHNCYLKTFEIKKNYYHRCIQNNNNLFTSASPFFDLWKLYKSSNGKSAHTSPFSTKNAVGLPARIWSRK